MSEYLPGGWRLYVRAAVLVLATMAGVAVVGHALPATAPWMQRLIPIFLLVAGVLVVLPACAAGRWRFAAWAAAAYAFILLAEVAGVATGAVFGDFAYGSALGWKWRGVPLLVAANWMLVVNGAVCLAGRIVPPSAGIARCPALALLAGVIVVAFDGLMEPVMARLDGWRWAAGAVPTQNYLAWFALAAALALFHPRALRTACDLGTMGRLAGIYVLVQAAFFAVMRLT
ncbi:MAG TPA: carotenoid biosynthesis protein [Kiritimatiellia bacterium]|nr:carotenoid biosynthesis protein [Kiritimatiellia bacterium]